MIVGITGGKRAGKDTIANHLCDEYGYQRFSFAAPLKEAVNRWLGAVSKTEDDREDIQRFFIYNHNLTKAGRFFGFEGDALVVFESRFFEVMEGYCTLTTDAGKEYQMSYRQLLQYLGTDVCRYLNDNVWVDFMDKATNSVSDVVISDVRFENEADFINHNFGELIEVDNPRIPKVDGHKSEAGIAKEKIGYFICNNGSIEDLYKEVNKTIGKHIRLGRLDDSER